jgi:hypothetical protein
MRIDHVLYGVRDLFDAQRWFAETSGLHAIPGGVHPELGTENALIPAGPGQYIELLAITDNTVEHPFPKVLSAMLAGGDRPIGVCLRPDDLDAIAARLDVPVQDMHRETPDGGRIEWRLAGMQAALGPQRLPFFIDWGGRAAALDAENAAAVPDGAIAWVEIGGDREELSNWLGEPVDGLRSIGGAPGIARFALRRDDAEIVIGPRNAT